MTKIDLRIAIKRLDEIREVSPKIAREYRIGIVNKKQDNPRWSQRPGKVILYKDEFRGQVTIETPMDDEYLAEHLKRHPRSLLRTICCTIGFPKDYIDEVLV